MKSFASGILAAIAFGASQSSHAGNLGQNTADAPGGAVAGQSQELSVAIEFYHPGLDHYFLTADPRELEAITGGKFEGWIRTGEKFAVLPSNSTNAASTPVCRFFAPDIGSHFYSGIPSECDEVLERFPNSWVLESTDVYGAFLPDVAGNCPSDTQPVYRLWNGRADVNHRYTTNPNLVRSMKSKGYVAEGFGLALSIPVALCAPVGLSCALVASNPTPIVGSQVSVTAACTGDPKSYVWSGCDSESDTCSTTSSVVGVKTYGVVASDSESASDPAAIAIDWKPVGTIVDGASQAPSCTITASTTTPMVASTVTLSVLCTVIPTSYSWNGCTSTTSTCTAMSATAGNATYSVTTTTQAGNTSPSSVTITWQGSGTATPPVPSANPTPSTTPAPSATPTSNIRTPIASIPTGAARVISSNTLAGVWQGAQPAGGGSIDKAVAAWNSGIFAPTLGASGSIVFAGGGDADSWDTAVFAFDIATGVWSRIKDRTNALSWNPAIDNALPTNDSKHWDRIHGEHGDGTPGAPHTYDLVTFLPPEAVGGKGALLYPVSRYMYTQDSTNWAHKLTLDQRAWSRASTTTVPANINLLGMSDYDPTSKRVWIVSATGSGAYSDAIHYLDFSAGSGVGIPGSIPLGRDYLIYGGTMRFWRGTDGTKRFLVILSYDPRSRINIIDLDAPETGVHPVRIANAPTNFGYPGSGFALGRSIGFALHPSPDQDASQIYEIIPPADALNGTWTATAKPLVGITLPTNTNNNGLWKRLEWHEALGVATFFISARGPVYAYRPGTTTPTPTVTPTPTPTPTPSTTPSLAGSLKLSMQTVPFTGPATVLGISKNLNFARVGNRWYKCAGDHRAIDANTPEEQGGRQEIISFNVPANDWRKDQPYFLRSGMNLGEVQIAKNDDGACVARNDEIWSFVSERVDQRNTAEETAFVRANWGADIVTQDMDRVGAWNVTTKKWRLGGVRPQEMRGDRAWRALWDAQTDRFIVPVPTSFLIFDKDGNDISPRFGTGQTLQDYGNFDFHATGIVQDGRTAYVYDQNHGVLYSFNLDQSPFALTPVLTLGSDLVWLSAGPGLSMVWHEALRAIVIGSVERKMYAFEVDTGKLTKWERPDGFVNNAGTWIAPSTMFYDPDSKDIVSVGGIDWDTAQASTGFWRLHITR